jgi:lysophospholipase L1-like esterase
MKPLRSLRIILVSMLFSVPHITRAGEPLPPDIFNAGERILFQGDSITDMNRGRTADPNHILGHSYAFLIAARYGSAYPERRLVFLNRGVSGNRVPDLIVRWKPDTLDLKPDVLSILIGVNDVGSAIRDGKPFSIDEYEKSYDQLLAEAVAANPKIRLVLCEPFILPGARTSARWDDYEKAIAAEQAAVQRLGGKYDAAIVHLQRVFDAAAKMNVPADYWIWDGVHPTYAGQQLLADEWVRTYREVYGEVKDAPTTRSAR